MTNQEVAGLIKRMNASEIDASTILGIVYDYLMGDTSEPNQKADKPKQKRTRRTKAQILEAKKAAFEAEAEREAASF